MPVFLIRHAKAGSRHEWTAPDGGRPLSRGGWKQANALASRLSGEVITRLLSSPSLRCRQTLEPLAERLGLGIEIRGELSEGNRFDSVLPLLDEVADGTALCSHGDVIPSVIDALIRRGLDVIGSGDTRKASMWVLERDGDGEFSRAHAEPPPDS